MNSQFLISASISALFFGLAFFTLSKVEKFLREQRLAKYVARFSKLSTFEILYFQKQKAARHFADPALVEEALKKILARRGRQLLTDAETRFKHKI